MTNIVEPIGQISLEPSDADFSTEDITTTNTYPVRFIEKVFGKVTELLNQLPRMSNGFEEIIKSEEKVRNVVASITKVDPDTCKKLNQIQEEYRSFILVGKKFLWRCVQLAEYATDQEHVQIIRQELKNESVHKLQKYANSILNLLKHCKIPYEEFQAAQQKLRDSVSKSKENLHSKAKEAKEAAEDAKRRLSAAQTQHSAITGLPALAQGVGVVFQGLSFAGSATDLTLVLLVNSLSSLALYLARSNESDRMMLQVSDRELDMIERAKEQKILDISLDAVTIFNRQLLDTSATIEGIESISSFASTTMLEPEAGLQTSMDSNREDIDFYYLRKLFESLQTMAINLSKKLEKMENI